eukprot:NODE_1014_length_1163_cov_469.877917_g770_i0.p1 GENE.NODE_1014_length_1163_cov_469.877917_g770_i0~~NODE_1014_length_1163_cov_469.877917_g770_i0.p1  ORF type:complete len:288 (-),score=74.15 NODE_1014_length_1163_cov_469.877917_g770_i0:267-1130(-)
MGKRVGPGKNVEFVCGTKVEADTIVCNIGFQIKFEPLNKHMPKIAMDAGRPRDNLYHGVVHPLLRERLFFCGFQRPTFGAIPPLAEMQARYFALLLDGDRVLPTTDEMERRNEAERAVYSRQFKKVADRYAALVDHVRYYNNLAMLVGCHPDVISLAFKQPKLAYKVVMGPHCPQQFRLFGPDAKPALATETIMRFPVHWRRLTFISCGLWGFGLALNLLGFKRGFPVGMGLESNKKYLRFRRLFQLAVLSLLGYKSWENAEALESASRKLIEQATTQLNKLKAIVL